MTRPLRSVRPGIDPWFPGPALLLLAVTPLGGQEPPDSLQVADTAQVADSAQAPDTAAFRRLPVLEVDDAPTGFTTGIWEWSREDLLSTEALTLVEFLTRVPGMIPLKGGDHGTPETATAFGLAGGRIRVYLDGFELPPMDGGVVDLGLVGLGGIEGIRVERGMGEIRIELASLQASDPRPESVIEAGTGDLDTNHFRGTLVHPDALGGDVGVQIERIDTRGPRARETGSRSGSWIRYTRHWSDRLAAGVEFRRYTAEIDLDTFPENRRRTDVLLRGRMRLTDGVVAEAFAGRSTISGTPVPSRAEIDGERAQYGVRASFRRDGFWALGAYRFFGGGDLPGSTVELEAGMTRPDVGGASVRWSRDGWQNRAAALSEARVWTRPRFGLSAFASWHSGVRGTRVLPLDAPEEPDEGTTGAGQQEEPEDPVLPSHRFTDRTGLRVGAGFARGPLEVQVAWLRQEADSLVPLGLHTDRAGVAVPGGEFTGYEAGGRLALPWLPGDGFGVYGSYQTWDEEARYLPKEIFQAGIDFNQRFLESGNFELWGYVGIRARDGMSVPLADPSVPEGEPVRLRTVPYYSSWDGFFQLRIVTVRAWVRFENITMDQRQLDFPGRVQHFTRATYGVRWTLWN